MDERSDSRTDAQTDGLSDRDRWADRRTDKPTDSWTDGRASGHMIGWTDRRTDGQTSGRMDRQSGGGTDRRTNIFFHQFFKLKLIFIIIRNPSSLLQALVLWSQPHILVVLCLRLFSSAVQIFLLGVFAAQRANICSVQTSLA